MVLLQMAFSRIQLSLKGKQQQKKKLVDSYIYWKNTRN